MLKLILKIFLIISILKIIVDFIFGTKKFLDDPVLFFGRTFLFSAIIGFIIYKLEKEVARRKESKSV